MLSPRSRSHDALVRAVMLRRRLAESKSSSSRASRLASLVVVQAPPTRTRLARQMAPGVALCARWTTLPQRLRARHAQPLECWTLHTHLPGHAILALPHHRQAAPTSPSATTSNVRVDVWMCGCVWMCVHVEVVARCWWCLVSHCLAVHHPRNTHSPGRMWPVHIRVQTRHRRVSHVSHVWAPCAAGRLVHVDLLRVHAAE